MKEKKRWISLLVENEVGALAKIAGLFSGKAYNLESLTVGETEDTTISRMTIGLRSNDMIFEQVKKQLNRCVGVIKVIDLTNTYVHMKEILFIRLSGCAKPDKEEAFRICDVFGLKVIDYDKNGILIQCVASQQKNDEIIKLFKSVFAGKVSLVRGGNVAIEAISSVEG